MKYHSISVDQAIYATSVEDSYLDTTTVKTGKKFYKTTFTSDMILTKADTSTSDDQVDNLTREFNTHYRSCIGSYDLFVILKSRFEFCSAQVRNVFIKSW